jgi:TFIIF-interacting CTD phosphatase-like protein
MDVLVEGKLRSILLRPGVVEFLEQTTQRYETHIFTRATQNYADAVLDALCGRIGNPSAFARRQYRLDCEHCLYLNNDTKPLDKISPNLKRIVHVYDKKRNFFQNPRNGILVKGFVGDPKDDSLPKVWNMLNQLDTATDVRDVLQPLLFSDHKAL